MLIPPCIIDFYLTFAPQFFLLDHWKPMIKTRKVSWRQSFQPSHFTDEENETPGMNLTQGDTTINETDKTLFSSIFSLSTMPVRFKRAQRAPRHPLTAYNIAHTPSYRKCLKVKFYWIFFCNQRSLIRTHRYQSILWLLMAYIKCKLLSDVLSYVRIFKQMIKTLVDSVLFILFVCFILFFVRDQLN